jgi:hypothetical protein
MHSMDNVNEVAFFSALVVTVPVGVALIPTGPMVLGHSLVAIILASMLILSAFALITGTGSQGNGWRRAGPIFLIGGIFIGLGSTEIMAALLLALIVIDILLGTFTGAERLVNLGSQRVSD